MCKYVNYNQVTQYSILIIACVMDNNVQEQFIHKKLLHKFQKKLDLVVQQYLRQMYPSSQSPRRLSQEELIKEIVDLQFINFKYRSALVCSNKDLVYNEEQILNQDSKIFEIKEEIKSLEEEKQKAAVINQNKNKFNLKGRQLMKFDKKADIDKKFAALEDEIKELDEKYQKDMMVYHTRQRYLKASLSALQSFFNDIEKRRSPQTQRVQLRSESKQIGEDDGQIY